MISGFTVVMLAPERAEAPLDLLTLATAESGNFHINLDRTQVVNYTEWQSCEAIAAAGDDPRSFAARICDAAQIPDSFYFTSCATPLRRP